MELARKKKQALDNLFNSGKISACTYDSLDNQLINMIADIEMRQKILVDNLASKVEDLEKQIGTLEVFLAQSEIQYVAGEINDELHANETSAFSNGLGSLRKQLCSLKEAVGTFTPAVVESIPISAPVEAEPLEFVEMPDEARVEETVEIPVEATEEIQQQADQTVEASAENTAQMQNDSENEIIDDETTEETHMAVEATVEKSTELSDKEPERPAPEDIPDHEDSDEDVHLGAESAPSVETELHKTHPAIH